ncbi:outer membrane beta-barrel protein, partial [Escherichia coli]|nr:outer membrane beta-barrel protein [Escherichia coli]
YGLGLQFNPSPQFAVDLSYERSKPGDLSNSIWMLGVGYRF